MVECNKQLEEKMNTLSELEHNYEELQEKFNSKYGEGMDGDGGAGGGGTSGVMKVKNALRHLKEELSLLYLREGVIAQSVMECRIQKQHAARKHQQRQYRNKTKLKSSNKMKSDGEDSIEFD